MTNGDDSIATEAEPIAAQPVPAPDVVEAALAAGIEAASAAGEWTTVRALTGELEARRLARVGVADLEVEARATPT